MAFISSSDFLIFSAVYCMLFTSALVPIGIRNPRMMLQDYPRKIQDAVPPKTLEEKRLGILYAVPLVFILTGFPALVSWYYNKGGGFVDLFAGMWGLMLVMNLFDLVIIDWAIFCGITPKFVVLPGTEGNQGYKDYWFHFVGFLKGVAITAALSAVVMGIIAVITI